MGFHSFKTHDTNRSIPNKHSSRKCLTVHMVNPINGRVYIDTNYSGYGVFGGKDYYILLAQMNGLEPEIDGPHTMRDLGLRLFFNPKVDTIYPVLLENPKEDPAVYQWLQPLLCDEQGYFYAD